MTHEPQALPSHPVHVRVLPRGGIPVTLNAGPAERQALAKFAGALAVDHLAADLLVRRWRGAGVSVSGRLRATVEQACVVTLAPVVQTIDEAIDMTFLPADSPLARSEAGGEIVLDPLGPDLPETLTGDEIDLWAIVAECLVLALDPFPRSPGASLADTWHEAGEETGDSGNPFAVLARRKPPR